MQGCREVEGAELQCNTVDEEHEIYHEIAVHEEDGKGCALFLLGLHLSLVLYFTVFWGKSKNNASDVSTGTVTGHSSDVGWVSIAQVFTQCTIT